MTFYIVKPEVAGCIGSDTVGDRTVYPPVIEQLQYEFEDWLGDDVVSSVGVWVGTKSLQEALEAIGVTGLSFKPVDVIKAKQFNQWNPGGLKLPQFLWFDIIGKAGVDDFGRSPDHSYRAVVSQRALDVMKNFKLEFAKIEELQTPAKHVNP